MTIDLRHIPKNNNVYYITPENGSFSDIYLKVRDKENRILSDDEVKKLPYLKKNEWPYRVKSTERFTTYISKKNKPLDILTIGCGNGWFSNRIADVSSKNTIIGLDINKIELEQAARVFKKHNLHFVYANIFEVAIFFYEKLDIIVLNGAIQYFEDFQKLIQHLHTFLRPKGEIHIIDSPFYNTQSIVEAQERTTTYYLKLGFPEMTKNYYHHNIKDVSDFKVLYKKKSSIINKIFGRKDSPFSWYRLTK